MARLTVRIDFREGARLGPGKIALLEAVALHGSITAAAKSLGMSYRRAWLLIEEVNAMFEPAVVETAHGGAKGGGAMLTSFGRDVVARYRRIEEALDRAASRELQFLEGKLSA
ncbi:MAG: LysR family transcriptional regulator [Gemmatimonadaceae bacterium]|nr:LysR family transcriptional regulator [Gemmatimonadaceae bacterium]